MIDLTEVPEYYQGYVENVSQLELIDALKLASTRFAESFSSLSESQSAFRYEPSKWSIKELVSHLIDSERIFALRAFRFSRGDDQALPGFDQNKYLDGVDLDMSTFHQLVQEMTALQTANLFMYKSMTDDMLHRNGMASGVEVNAKVIAYIQSGHAIHHINVFKERYNYE